MDRFTPLSHAAPVLKQTAAAFLLSSALLAGCDRGTSEAEIIDVPVEFGSGSVEIQSEGEVVRLGVEVAESEPQRRRGLMERTSLHPDSGMIFLFDEEQPPEGVFWMYRTRIPLSIAFIQPDGTIGSIREMEPCTSDYPQWCPNYEAGVPYTAALEANGGFFAERGIGVGDTVVFTPG